MWVTCIQVQYHDRHLYGNCQWTLSHITYNLDQTFEYLKNRQYFIHVEGPYIMPVIQQILQ